MGDGNSVYFVLDSNLTITGLITNKKLLLQKSIEKTIAPTSSLQS